MSQKTCGTLLLFALVAGVCALALFGPAGHSPKWCTAGSVETLFTSCDKVAVR